LQGILGKYSYWHGSITPNGLPYFVMEYIDGARLDDFCREHKQSILERLALFRKICGAVAYAHQRLVIHRDLKPANIHVTGDGEPKLLDFGIAKLIDPTTSTIPEMTLTFAAVMTPEYASPEQVRVQPMTTASDVYSLGVILYELLTGQRLYQFKSRNPTETARVIAEQGTDAAERGILQIRAIENSTRRSRQPRAQGCAEGT
jgi:eukaryotic-like serine/threonine-protein kinase